MRKTTAPAPMTVLTISATDFVRNCRSVIDQLDRYEHVVIERHNEPVAHISRPPKTAPALSAAETINALWGRGLDPVTGEPDHDWTELQATLRPLEELVDPYERRSA